MLTAVVTTSHTAGQFEVSFVQAEGESCERIDRDGEIASGEECPELNPIAPEVKELVWGFGAFVVLAVVLRYVLFPKVRAGMTARYEGIRGDFEAADTLTAAARAEVAEYDAQVAALRVDAQRRVEAARATLEAERAEKLAEVNARLAEKRAAAAAEVEAARAAQSSQVASAVSSVAAYAGQLATGRTPDEATVASVVDDVMGANA